MISILHGENISLSRKKLLELIAEEKKKHTQIIRLEGKKLDRAILEESLGSSSLFGNDTCIVIEELHSLPRSKKKTELISLIAATQDTTLILWEKRKLTPTMIKQFPGARVFAFKPSETLFSWLDSLDSAGNKNRQLELFAKATQSNDVHMCFVMLIRQIRLLIATKSGGQVKGAPFLIQKLRSQANRFTLEKLLETHSTLYTFDSQMKSSANSLPLKESLDLLLLKL